MIVVSVCLKLDFEMMCNVDFQNMRILKTSCFLNFICLLNYIQMSFDEQTM